MTILDDINSLLNDEINKYTMSLFLDTRLYQDISKQYFEEPLGFAKIVKIMKDNQTIIIDLVRKYDSKSYTVANLMSTTKDPIKRLAYWVQYYVG